MPAIRNFKGGAASSNSKVRGAIINGFYYRIESEVGGFWSVEKVDEMGARKRFFSTRREAQEFLQSLR